MMNSEKAIDRRERLIWILTAGTFSVFLLTVFLLTDSSAGGWRLRGICAVFAVLCLTISLALAKVYRRRMVHFTDQVCDCIDKMVKSDPVDWHLEEDTLFSKVQAKIKRLDDITRATADRSEQQKQEVQRMVSDISHQLKTPIANITMYHDTILNHPPSPEKQHQFLQVMQGQVEKLEFLVKALIKMSRLESDLIVLKKEEAPLYDTIAQALGAVMPAAEKKEIAIQVACDETILLAHDRKWTAEAIFNVLENGVKYTPPGGSISIQVEPWEIFTRIQISDTGIGIDAAHYNDIFQRFYREGKVQQEEGLGIGLYLTRRILTQQGGYIKVQSKEGEGSTFSLFLPNG